MNFEGFVFLGFIINIGLCFLVGAVANKKGRRPALWFFVAFVFSALIGLIALLILGNSETKRIERLREEKVIKDLIEAGFVGTPVELAREAKSRVGAAEGMQSNVKEPANGRRSHEEAQSHHKDDLSRALAIGLVALFLVLLLISIFDKTLFLG